ncbi:MAG: hypothetical protein M3066_17805 [Actinomycetota bacterium]|nr:hypothetical protein [Actinomycetota bacterium]
MAARLVTRAPAPEEERPARHRPFWLLLGLAALLFVAFAGRVIPAPFGDSHDGRNAGVWASGSRALLAQGPFESRLGTRSPENGVYANHPPLLYVETALFQAVGGDSPAVTRAPAWLGSLAVLALLAALLLDAGLHPTAVGASVVLVAATPMFLVYGAMLDTPVTSLPFALAVLLCRQRVLRGRRVPWPLAAGLTAAAVLAGWQSLVVAAVVGGWALLGLRRGSGDRTSDAAFAGGALAGAVLLFVWVVWAFGGTLAPLFDQFRLRTGETVPVPLGSLASALRGDVTTMFGIAAVLGAAGLIVAVRDRRTRMLAAVALAVTLPYPVVFRSGAVNHDYWTYWFLLPIAIGLAAGVDRLLAGSGTRIRRERLVAAAATAVAVVLIAGLWSRPDAPLWAILQGRPAGAVAAASTLPPGQEVVWYMGAVGRPAAWLALATGKPAVAVATADRTGLAEAHPRDLVFVGRLRCIAGEPHVDYAYETATDLLNRPPEIPDCGQGR